MCAQTLAQWRRASSRPLRLAPHLSRPALGWAARGLRVSVQARLSSVKEPQPKSKRACEVHAEIHKHFGANKWFKPHSIHRPPNGSQHETATHHAQQPCRKESSVNGKNWIARAEQWNAQQQCGRAREVFPRSYLGNVWGSICGNFWARRAADHWQRLHMIQRARNTTARRTRE